MNIIDKEEDNMNEIMKCGCRATGTLQGKPVCVVHLFLLPGAQIVNENPDLDKVLEKRIAKCIYCHTQANSNRDLPFFEYKPDQKRDIYYCGCRGWD